MIIKTMLIQNAKPVFVLVVSHPPSSIIGEDKGSFYFNNHWDS